MLKSLDKKEVLRYLGYRSEQVDPQTAGLIDQCERQLLNAIRPRVIWREFPLSFGPENVAVSGTTLVLEGTAIRRHLQGCERVLLFCATLSQEVDRLIRQAQVTDAAKGLVMDCCATTAIEQVCDEECDRLAERFAAKQCYLTTRFSPGYGDLPIDIQKEFVTVLDAQRKIGLCVTESNLLIPRKSVTAIIGVSHHQRSHGKKSCDACSQKERCPYRRKGEQCGL